MKKHPIVLFYKVTDNQSKIRLISQKAQEAYQKEERLLISTPNLPAAQYVDELLWNYPEESFMPHAISDTPLSDWIAITMQSQLNVNQAARQLNLCPTPSELYDQMEEIYEFLDHTTPQKVELSQQRFRFYEGKGFTPKIISNHN
jgi:DNA polymerase-3 subunit chi